MCGCDRKRVHYQIIMLILINLGVGVGVYGRILYLYSQF